MNALDSTEIVPGLVVELDPIELSKCRGVLTNARQEPGASRVADRPGPFIVLVSEVQGWLCAPTFSNGYRGFELDQKLKAGPVSRWVNHLGYFNMYQFWIIPSECMIKASITDGGTKDDRCSYAVNNPEELARIASYRDKSDAGYHPISN